MSNEIFDKKIVIIEDSQVHRKMIVAKLKRAGFTNVVDYEESIEAFQDIAEDQLTEKSIDLVITDLNMPELDGMDLIFRLQEDVNTRDLKVMVLSGDGDELVKEEAYQLGVKDYIVKPFDLDDFKERILKVLQD
jgi:CheY-like chemotaxis protein